MENDYNSKRMDESRIRPKSDVLLQRLLISYYYYIIMHRAWFISQAGAVAAAVAIYTETG